MSNFKKFLLLTNILISTQVFAISDKEIQDLAEKRVQLMNQLNDETDKNIRRSLLDKLTEIKPIIDNLTPEEKQIYQTARAKAQQKIDDRKIQGLVKEIIELGNRFDNASDKPGEMDEILNQIEAHKARVESLSKENRQKYDEEYSEALKAQSKADKDSNKDNDKEIIAMARSWDEAVNELADTRGQYDTGKSLAVLQALNTKKETMVASALKKFQVTRNFFKNATQDNDDFDPRDYVNAEFLRLLQHRRAEEIELKQIQKEANTLAAEIYVLETQLLVGETDRTKLQKFKNLEQARKGLYALQQKKYELQRASNENAQRRTMLN